jgi:hypothetical protein
VKLNASCGHTEYDRGHCGHDGCENDFRRCPDSDPPAFPKRNPVKDADDMFEAAFGWRPGGTPS